MSQKNMEGAFLLEISKRIKNKRIEKRLTLQELADKSGVSKGLISQIENGRSIPSLPVMFSIIQSLEIAVLQGPEPGRTYHYRPERNRL